MSKTDITILKATQVFEFEQEHMNDINMSQCHWVCYQLHIFQSTKAATTTK